MTLFCQQYGTDVGKVLGTLFFVIWTYSIGIMWFNFGYGME